MSGMSWQTQHRSFWHRLPLIGFIAVEWQVWRAERTTPCYTLAPTSEDGSALPPYPIDMWPLLALPLGPLDEAGVPYYVAKTKDLPNGYYATAIAQYALARWNAYLSTGNEKHKQSFMIQADWLVEHETRLSDDAGGWPFPVPSPDYHASSLWLSSLIQGNCISVLVRAFILTGKEDFLQAARRAKRAFELDIRDGGVSTSIGDGVFFEEVAAYPAAHILNGYIFSLFGLYDYVAITGDSQAKALISRSLATMHSIIDEYDLGYWSRYDLLHGSPASMFYHDQHAVLLVALSRYSGCEHCVELAARWAGYKRSLHCLLRYIIVSRFVRYRRGLQRSGLRGAFTRVLRSESPPILKRVSYLNSTLTAAQSSSGDEVIQ